MIGEQDESTQLPAGDGPNGRHGFPAPSWISAESALVTEYLTRIDSPPLLFPSEHEAVPVTPQTTDVRVVSGAAGAGGGGGGGVGAGGGAGAAEATTAEGADVATPEPYLFVAMTVTRSVFPTSAVDSTYVRLRAPEIVEHAAPAASQRAQ